MRIGGGRRGRKQQPVAKRVDALQSELVAALRAVGALVILTHRQGDGCPDCFAFFRGRWFALEYKAPGGSLTPLQRELQVYWPGAIQVVRSIEEALDAIGAERYTVDEPMPPRGPVRI